MMFKKLSAISICLAAMLIIGNIGGITAAADDATLKTPSQAVAEMTWGTNLCDLFMADVEYPQGSVHGYVDYGSAATFGLAAWFGEDGFDWLAYHDMYNGTFEVSVDIPDHSSVKNWTGSLFELGVMTTSTDYTVAITLSDSKLVKKDGSVVKLDSMNKTYSGTTAEGPDMNGWCRYVINAPAETPKPGSSLNGAVLHTTVTVQKSNTGGQSKAEYFYQKDRYKMDREKLTDLFIEEGANVFRLPVTWTSFVNDTTFEIDKEWLDMIKEEVDYILSKGAYCILDMHNDYLMRSFVGVKKNGTWTDLHWERDWMLDEYSEYVNERFKAVWSQIAEYFKDYPQQLIFETANEPSTEWYEDISYDMNEVAVKRVNEMNKMFVDTVRASGGKNAQRFLCLAVANYNTYQFLSDVILPDDDGLMVQLHSYNEMEYNTNNQDYKDVNPSYDYVGQTDKLFDAVAKFQQQHPDVPVIIGEDGISQKMKDSDAAPRAEYFYTKAKEYGVPCLWWEDYFVTEEKIEYWLYDKAAQKWGRPTLLEIIKEKAGLADPVLTGIKVNSTGHKTKYLTDEPLDVSGLTIIADMSRGKDPVINVTKDMISGFDSSAPKEKQTLTITYQGKKTTYDITVSLPEMTGFKLASRGVNSLKLSWSKASGATGYELEIQKNGKWSKAATINNGGTVSYTITGLSAGTYYPLRVRAFVKSGGNTVYSAWKTGSANTSPSNMTGFKLASRGVNSVKLSWTKNTSASGYQVGVYKGGKWVSYTVKGNGTTSYTVSGLSAGTKYSVRVRAYKTNGSSTIYGAWKTGSANTSPSNMTGFKLASRGVNSVKLSWTKNTSASGYQVGVYKGGKWVSYTVKGNGTTSYTVSGLSAGTKYNVRVRAYKTSGSSTIYGAWKTGSVNTSPSNMTGFKLKSKTTSSLTLQWSKNASATGYQLQIKKGGKWVSYTVKGNSTTSCAIKSLSKNTKYNLRIRAYKIIDSSTIYGAWKNGSASTKK